MLIRARSLDRMAILSLHTGSVVSRVTGIITNPHNLELTGFYCTRPGTAQHILLTQDIRQLTPSKMIIDSVDEITPREELLRIEEILAIDYQVIGKPVRSESRRHLGKVSDYAIDTDTLQVQKLYVAPSLWRSFLTNNFIIDREQVVEVTDKYITVNDTWMRKPKLAPEQAA